MDDTLICQSCGMPLDPTDVKGTERDGSPSDDYCMHCSSGGAFTRDITMEEMIQTNIMYLDEWIESTGVSMTPEEAVAELRKYLPTLRRWQ